MNVATNFKTPYHPDKSGTGARSKIQADLVSGGDLADLNDPYRDLLSRAAELNAFMSPHLLSAASEALPQLQILVVTAWEETDTKRRLVGLWAISPGVPTKSAMPLPVLQCPPFSQSFLATPVLDRTVAREALHAMLDRIAAERKLPEIIAIRSMSADGLVSAALFDVLGERDTHAVILERRNRPMLQSQLDAESYFNQSMSKSSRKKLRQMRNGLARLGNLRSEVITQPVAVARAVEQFLQLEAAGWKGQQATAILSDKQEAVMFSTGVSALALEGNSCIHALYLDDCPIAMQVVVRSIGAVFTWKTAYDQKFQKYSPGILLLQDCSTRFLSDESIDFVDSCSEDDRGYMSAWRERRPVVDLWISPRRGGSILYRTLGQIEKAFRKARISAKRIYHHYR